MRVPSPQVPICRARLPISQSQFELSTIFIRMDANNYESINSVAFRVAYVRMLSQHQFSLLPLSNLAHLAAARFVAVADVRLSALLPLPFRELLRKRNRELKVIHLPRCC